MSLVRSSGNSLARRVGDSGGLLTAIASALTGSQGGEAPHVTYLRNQFNQAMTNPAHAPPGVDVDAAGNVVYRGRAGKRKRGAPAAITYKPPAKKAKVSNRIITTRGLKMPKYVRRRTRRAYRRRRTRKQLYPKKHKRPYAYRRRRRVVSTKRAAWGGYKCAKRCWGLLGPTKKTLRKTGGGFVDSIHVPSAGYTAMSALFTPVTGTGHDEHTGKFIRAAGCSINYRIFPYVITEAQSVNYNTVERMDQWFKIWVIRGKNEMSRGKSLSIQGGSGPPGGTTFNLFQDLYEAPNGNFITEPRLWRKKTFTNDTTALTDRKFQQYYEVVYEKTIHLVDGAGPRYDSVAMAEGEKRLLVDMSRNVKREYNGRIWIPYRKLIHMPDDDVSDDRDHMKHQLYFVIQTCNGKTNEATPSALTDAGVYYSEWDAKMHFYDVGDSHTTL